MTVIKFFFFLLFLSVVVLFATLYRNDANLFQEPGISERLKIFLTTNKAKIEDDHVLPELRTPVFQEDASRLFGRIVHEATEMGWTVSSTDRDNQQANFTVSSPIFLFKDDVFVQVKLEGMKRSTVYMESQSRTGNGDLAANSSHIQNMLRRLRTNQ